MFTSLTITSFPATHGLLETGAVPWRSSDPNKLLAADVAGYFMSTVVNFLFVSETVYPSVKGIE